MENSKEQRIITIAVVKNNSGDFLIQKRSDKEFPTEDGRWELPGGGVDEGETLEEAVRRECEEEVGMVVRVIGELPWVYDISHNDNNGKNVSFHVHCFVCAVESGEARPANDEVSEIRWIKGPELNGLNFPAENKKFVELAGFKV